MNQVVNINKPYNPYRFEAREVKDDHQAQLFLGSQFSELGHVAPEKLIAQNFEGASKLAIFLESVLEHHSGLFKTAETEEMRSEAASLLRKTIQSGIVLGVDYDEKIIPFNYWEYESRNGALNTKVSPAPAELVDEDEHIVPDDGELDL